MADSDKEETIHARRRRLRSLPRACEGCRLRKIRCDRSDPCANCRSLGIACQTPNAKPESRPKSDRVLFLQEQVERLESRLSTVEDQLRSSKRPSATEAPVHQGSYLPQVDAAPVYEGGSSFTNQSLQATEIAQLTASTDGDGRSSSLNASLSYLKNLLRPSSTLSDYQFSSNSASRPMPKITHLPVELILDVIRITKTRPPIFLSSYVINDASLFERLCQRVYFPTEPFSLGESTSMHGILYCFLREFIILQDPLCQSYDLKAHLATCQQNFAVGIETYDLVVVPSFENILALAMGGTRAQDESKPLLCATLFSAAARNLQMLGYHREITYQNDRSGNTENIRRLFWTVYTFDRNMSLLIGRTSCIQDIEVDSHPPTPTPNPAIRPWDESFILAIKLARLQGQVYSRLYSTAALTIEMPERLGHINDLANALHQWYHELSQIDGSQVNHPQVYQLSRTSWEIMYYSTLTTILRASSTAESGAEISSECFKAARLALQGHLRCMPDYQTSGFLSAEDYANWVLVFSSFTPFIVIFLHAIAASSLEDVELLDEVVRTIELIRSASQASERLYKICSTFARLARGLAETQRSYFGTYSDQDDSFRLFSEAGQPHLFHPESMQGLFETQEMNDLSSSEAYGMTAILGNWASGQPPAMDLLGVNQDDN